MQQVLSLAAMGKKRDSTGLKTADAADNKAAGTGSAVYPIESFRNNNDSNIEK
jgi:hypothetical protein